MNFYDAMVLAAASVALLWAFTASVVACALGREKRVLQGEIARLIRVNKDLSCWLDERPAKEHVIREVETWYTQHMNPNLPDERERA